jgi:hypothetical protein
MSGVRERSGEAAESAEQPSGPRRRRLADHWRKLAGGLVTLIVAPVAVALISDALSGDHTTGPVPAGGLGPGLRTDKVVVRNPRYDARQVQTVLDGVRQPAFKQTRASMPRVVLTVSNTGARRAVLTGMQFTVRDYAELRPCQAGAATLLDGTYQVKLPSPAHAGQSVRLDLDRDIAPDGVDRFALRFALPFRSLNLGGPVLYALDVAVDVAGVRGPRRIATIAVGLPGVPRADLDLDFGVPGVQAPRTITTCYARHRRDLERIAGRPHVVMDPAFAAVARQAARIDAAAG